MIDVALLSVIRRWYFREHISAREIARRTKLSRNTIAKYLENGVVEPRYVRRASPSKLDPFAEQLRTWLADNARQGRKSRRTAKQMHASLQQLGYPGSYGRVCDFARRWRREQQELAQTAGRGAFVPLQFAPGEAFQFDWSEDFAVIGGERTKLQIAHFKLSHSRAFVLRAYPLQTHEMLFDAHNHAFAVLGGVPRRGIYDNMKTAVDRVKPGKARDINARFTALTSHYLFEPQFCSPASGWEKGQIEKNVQDARRRLWFDAPAFASLDALNTWLQERCVALWREVAHPEHSARTIASFWEDERPQLMAVTGLFDGFVEVGKRVTPTCLVHFERNRYSVPATYAHRPVSLRIYADRIVAAAEGQIIAEHARHFDRHHTSGRTIYDWRHYLSVVQRKPGALRNGAPFADLPDGFKRLQATLLKRPGGDREMVEILALVLHHDEQAVLTAVELALESGAPSKPHVLNLLARLLGESPPAPVAAPPGLTLRVEPQANVERYDELRSKRHAA
ncbi:MAG: IS21 family transposase [Proteobacteria bacterium]|nr:IS21 family transposase [Pseudomonadota bacterium]